MSQGRSRSGTATGSSGLQRKASTALQHGAALAFHKSRMPPERIDYLMTDQQIVPLFRTLTYELLQATTMLLFLLSSIATNRQKQSLAPGVARAVMLPGLREIGLSLSIIEVPDDELYGPTGAAAQMAYKGWIAEVFGIWENRYRKDLKDSLGPNAIRPESEAFGDLREIRNDLLHNNGMASKGHSGKCTTLKWFRPDQRIVLGTRHVFDFLNQTGILALGGESYDPITSHTCSLRVIADSDTLLKWKPAPKIVSARVHDDGRNEDPPYRGITVAFDNGLFADLPFRPVDPDRRVALGDAEVQSDGNLVFPDGTVFESGEAYRMAVEALEQRKSGGGEPRLPVAGPPFRVRR